MQLNSTAHLVTGGDDPFLPKLLIAINQATHIDIAVSFVRLSGMELIKDALLDALAAKADVRVLTGDYLGITDPGALRTLMLLQENGAKVRIYETKQEQSFHMKAYIFARRKDETIVAGRAYVGSSNISRSALQKGLEWNLRIEWQENKDRFQELCVKFDSLYEARQAKALTHDWVDRYQQNYDLTRQIHKDTTEVDKDDLLPLPTPNEIQQEALLALQETRDEGYRRGLVVMATGLGKTWLSAFDTQQLNAKRVLFVAHREEILAQAEQTFVRMRPEAKVGQYQGQNRQLGVDMLFASIQTLGKDLHLKKFPTDYFDYIIVDEFHHSSAPTYRRLLAHFSPRFLLGLTATPERTDQSDILSLCDDNLVFQRDLCAGIDSNLLCPFHYYGIGDDTVDYSSIPWRNGKFDPDALLHQLATQARAKHALDTWIKYKQTRTLAFCVSQRHSDYMAKYFDRYGFRAVSVHSESKMRRSEALLKLADGDLDIIFSVDLFNEGVDLPAIDTVLMLRPTESKIVFLQQLGRGLRNNPGTAKEKLVVMDFIGNHISFFRKPEALFQIGSNNQARREFLNSVNDGSLALPRGCFVNYELKAFEFLVALTKTRVDSQIDLYESLKETLGRRPTLSEFYQGGGGVKKVRLEFGGWLQLVKQQGDLAFNEALCVEQHGPFLVELEITSLTKSFKLVLLDAFIQLDGFSQPINLNTLARRSFSIIARRPRIIGDLPQQYQGLKELPPACDTSWVKYWKGNPINAWIGGNSQDTKAYFRVEDGCFLFNQLAAAEVVESLNSLVYELINYRYLQYETSLQSQSKPDELAKIIQLFPDNRIEIPFFRDLKIACGHFSSSCHDAENMEYRKLPYSYGHLESAQHFIAQARGDSMDGGKNPVVDGDYLLLEVITPESAGSISNQVLAIERPDVGGDDQYLLRYVKKLGSDSYLLVANNPRYDDMLATDDMRTFARLKAVIDPADLFLHQAFYREDIPTLFGLQFNIGSWNTGHVCPKGRKEQFLLVTINKQGKNPEHQYHDYFVGNQSFHWQSQNSTDPISKKGLDIIHHEKNGIRIHLFVRKHKLDAGTGAPFYYLGPVVYEKHLEQKPMNVVWHLFSPLNDELKSVFIG